ncbi:MAG: hypothetical protein KDA85_04435, partial [Planctomycetaceae bacterium]|nr:hypothetical protein [Planctomycetaceae bacterium]
MAARSAEKITVSSGSPSFRDSQPVTTKQVAATMRALSLRNTKQSDRGVVTIDKRLALSRGGPQFSLPLPS